MPPIGETLREARMRQRLDIADVEQRTKIRAKYLRALENEEWSLLPGPTFVRTFLRTYAELLGLDPHVLVEEYRHAHEPRDDGELHALTPAAARDTRRAARGGGGQPRRGAVAAAVVVALLAFLLALGLLGGEDDPTPSSDRAGTTTTAPRTADPEPTERGGQAERQREQSRPAGVRVTIAPIEPTYLCVDNGPATDVVFEETIDAPQTFRHRRVVRINLGRRSPEITLNGEPVEVAESSEPLGLELRPGGATEIPEAERPCV